MPKPYAYLTLDVFTDRPFAGNPLAVFPDARGMSAKQMQQLAREFNYSESTFVLPPRNRRHTARVRIFNPNDELPFAGHPNVGTAYALALLAQRKRKKLAQTLLFEEDAGLVAVDLLRDARSRVTGAMLTAPQPLALGANIAPEKVAACLSLETGAVRTAHHRPVLASVGLPFVIAELEPGAIARAQPDLAAFRSAAESQATRTNRFSVFVYARQSDTQLRARMFAPLSGIQEDPATGSANCALAGLLAHLSSAADTVLKLDVWQGVEMGRPSRLKAVAEKRNGAVTRVRVGGRCALVMEGRVSL
jgi:trans-2,3-dihydro-3-hydroxyanthranilate isomerase